MVIEIQTDSDVWLKTKHALRAAGYRYSVQNHLYDDHVSLFLEPRSEPEEGRLTHGLIVYEGGAANFAPFCSPSELEEVRQSEINRASK